MTRPYAERIRRSNIRTQQYRNDPAYRIRMINYERIKRGAELLPPDAELPPVGKLTHRNRNRQRDERGRLI